MLAILVAPAIHRTAQQASAAVLVAQLQQQYRNAVFLYHSHAFVVLLGEIRYSAAEPILRPENNWLCEKLFSFFEAQGLTPGLSNSFQNLLRLRDQYHQALISARLAQRGLIKNRAVFLDLMPLPMFSTLLKANDRKYATDYEKTLCLYLLHLRDKEQTAAALHVHKNTLQYRLTRIGELFSVPLENTQTMLNLLCSALLLSLDPSLGDRPKE